MKRLTWVSSSSKRGKTASAKKVSEEKSLAKDSVHRVSSFLDGTTALISEERLFSLALLEMGVRVPDNFAFAASVQAIGTFHQVFAELKLKICNSLVENIQMPLKEHLNTCKDLLKAQQPGADIEVERLVRSRTAVVDRFCDYMADCTDFLRRVSEAAAEAEKVSQEMKSKLSTVPAPELSPRTSTTAPLTSKKPPGRVFGRSLTEIVEEAHLEVPPILDTLASWIERHGIRSIGLFRIAGNPAQVSSLRAQFDAEDAVHLPDTLNPHVACSLFKMFLRELPVPLIPFSCFNTFVSASTTDALQKAVHTLPKIHLIVLDWNIACLIAPTIMYRESLTTALEDAISANTVVESLMDQYDEVFRDVAYNKKHGKYARSHLTAPLLHRSTSSESLSASRRLSDTDVMLISQEKPTSSRRASHRRVGSENPTFSPSRYSVQPASSNDIDSGFQSDSPTVPSRRVGRQKSQRSEKAVPKGRHKKEYSTDMLRSNGGDSAGVEDSDLPSKPRKRRESDASVLHQSKRDNDFQSSPRVRRDSDGQSSRPRRDSEADASPRSRSRRLRISPDSAAEQNIFPATGDAESNKPEPSLCKDSKAHQRVAALLSPTDSSSPTETVAEFESPDAIGGVDISDIHIRQRRSQRVGDAAIMILDKHLPRDRTADLATLTFTDADQFNVAMDKVFSDTTTQTGFVLVGYSRGNCLVMQHHSQSGSIEDLMLHLRDEEIQYCLLRVSSPKKGIRDVFIQWNGSKVNGVQIGVKKGHSKEIRELFKPYHAELQVLDRSSLQLSKILEDL